jgi:hypothetical protein
MNGYWIMKLKIQLNGTPIWRRVEIYANTDFEKLHEIIQVVMGWQNYHLYEFVINDEHIMPEDDSFETPVSKYNLSTKLKKILKRGQIFEYIYDLGDNWRHIIEVEDVIHRRYQDIGKDVMNGIDKKYPYCLDGAKKCPPEDVGGVQGYYRVVESMNTKDEEYEENLEWFGSHYDEDDFDIKTVNNRLLKDM